eukprot:12099940-Alexandrium_andersonii.AAC.1
MSARLPACQHRADLSTQFDSHSLSNAGNCLISCLAGPRAARPSLQPGKGESRANVPGWASCCKAQPAAWQ